MFNLENPLKNIFLIGVVAFLFIASFFQVKAATVYFSPDVKNFGIGETFTTDIKIDSLDTAINAIQGTVKFAPGIFKLLSFDKAGSAFNFWLEEPIISNSDGTLSFITGTSKGISGNGIQVISLKFQTVGAGNSKITFNGGSVVANDGNGTNVLSTVKTANITVSTNMVNAVGTVEQPQSVTRPAVSAAKVPVMPQIRVPLYPDQTRWYSQIGETTVLWNLPDDITSASVRVTQKKETSIGTPEKSLLTGKSLGILKEGVQYIRVQFKNNIGWSEPAYYKISIDTTAPLPFGIKIDAVASDNPSPVISYETNDSLSGIFQYAVLIDGKEILNTASSSLSLPPQAPGKHTLVVRAYDLARNIVSDSIIFETIPLEQPIIQFYQRSIQAGELLFFSGKTLPMANVDVHLTDTGKQEVELKTVTADSLGHWELRMDQYIPAGTYYAYAIAKNEKGAMSYSTDSVEILVNERAIFSIGSFNFGWFDMVLIVLVIAMGLGGYFYRKNIMAEDRRSAFRIIAGRDFQNLSELLENNINGYEKVMNKFSLDEKTKMESDFAYKKVKDAAGKIRKYIGKELENIK